MGMAVEPEAQTCEPRQCTKLTMHWAAGMLQGTSSLSHCDSGGITPCRPWWLVHNAPCSAATCCHQHISTLTASLQLGLSTMMPSVSYHQPSFSGMHCYPTKLMWGLWVLHAGCWSV
jgi:hypothetical protein